MLSEDGLGPEVEAPQPQSVRPIGMLLTDLSNEIGTLVSQELALFKAEIQRNVVRAGIGAGALAAGGLIAFSGWLALLAAAIIGLSYALPPWLSALIIGVVVVALGGGLLLFGKSRLNSDALVPRRTVESLRADQAWIRDQFS
jgi:hypothetical protein